jgi:hypothetical protein
VTRQEWVEQWFYDVAAVATLPTPEAPFACSTSGIAVWFDPVPVPTMEPAAAAVIAAGYELAVRAALGWDGSGHAAILVGPGVTGEDIGDDALAAAEADGITRWDLEALEASCSPAWPSSSVATPTTN